MEKLEQGFIVKNTEKVFKGSPYFVNIDETHIKEELVELVLYHINPYDFTLESAELTYDVDLRNETISEVLKEKGFEVVKI